jgi:hypothetical protein
MPFEGDHANDIGLETPDGPVCVYDVKDGKMRSPEDIFYGGVEFFQGVMPNGGGALAMRLTRKNMKSLPYWQKHPFELLDGPEATDEEFAEAMAKM